MENLQGYRVCLEAGHGYHEDGTFDSGANNRGIHEHTLNAAQVERVASLLEAKGCSVTKVICTKGNGLSLSDRGRQGAGHHLFLSFHHNAFNTLVQGTEVLYHPLGSLADKHFAEALSERIAKALGFANRGGKKQNLGVLKTVPDSVQVAVLVESYFMDNRSIDPDDLEGVSLKAADAVAEYVAEYLLAKCKPTIPVMVTPTKCEPVKEELPPAEPKKIDFKKWKR